MEGNKVLVEYSKYYDISILESWGYILSFPKEELLEIWKNRKLWDTEGNILVQTELFISDEINWSAFEDIGVPASVILACMVKYPSYMKKNWTKVPSFCDAK